MGESQEKLYKRVREIIKSKINCIENYLSNFLFRRAEHSKTGDDSRSEQSSIRPRLPRLPSSSCHLPTLQGQIWRPRCGQVSCYMWPTHDVYATCHVSRAQGSWQQTLCDNSGGVQSEVTGRPAGAQKIHEGGEEKQPGEALQDSLWQTSCGRQSFHIQASFSKLNVICFVFICVHN